MTVARPSTTIPSATADYVAAANSLPSVVALPEKIDHRAIASVLNDPFVRADMGRFVSDVMINGPRIFDLGSEAVMSVAYALGAHNVAKPVYDAFIAAFAAHIPQPALYDRGYKAGAAHAPCPSYVDSMQELLAWVAGTPSAAADPETIRAAIAADPRLTALNKNAAIASVLARHPELIPSPGDKPTHGTLVIGGFDTRESTLRYGACTALVRGYDAVNCAPSDQEFVRQLLAGTGVAVKPL